MCRWAARYWQHHRSRHCSGPTGARRRLYGCPGIRDRIVDRAQTGQYRRRAASVVARRSAIIVLTALDDDATIRQHRGSKILRIIPARQRGDLRPGAVDVVAGNVRGQLIPSAGTRSMSNDCAIRKQQWIGQPAGRSCRHRLQLGVELAHVSLFRPVLIGKYLISLVPTFDFAENVGTENSQYLSGA
jgi:hypothetical protein